METYRGLPINIALDGPTSVNLTFTDRTELVLDTQLFKYFVDLGLISTALLPYQNLIDANRYRGNPINFLPINNETFRLFFTVY